MDAGRAVRAYNGTGGLRVGDGEDASEETTRWVCMDVRLAEYLFPCGGG